MAKKPIRNVAIGSAVGAAMMGALGAGVAEAATIDQTAGTFTIEKGDTFTKVAKQINTEVGGPSVSLRDLVSANYDGKVTKRTLKKAGNIDTGDVFVLPKSTLDHIVEVAKAKAEAQALAAAAEKAEAEKLAKAKAEAEAKAKEKIMADLAERAAALEKLQIEKVAARVAFEKAEESMIALQEAQQKKEDAQKIYDQADAKKNAASNKVMSAAYALEEAKKGNDTAVIAKANAALELANTDAIKAYAVVQTAKITLDPLVKTFESKKADFAAASTANDAALDALAAAEDKLNGARAAAETTVVPADQLLTPRKVHTITITPGNEGVLTTPVAKDTAVKAYTEEKKPAVDTAQTSAVTAIEKATRTAADLTLKPLSGEGTIKVAKRINVCERDFIRANPELEKAYQAKKPVELLKNKVYLAGDLRLVPQNDDCEKVAHVAPVKKIAQVENKKTITKDHGKKHVAADLDKIANFTTSGKISGQFGKYCNWQQGESQLFGLIPGAISLVPKTKKLEDSCGCPSGSYTITDKATGEKLRAKGYWGGGDSTLCERGGNRTEKTTPDRDKPTPEKPDTGCGSCNGGGKDDTPDTTGSQGDGTGNTPPGSKDNDTKGPKGDKGNHEPGKEHGHQPGGEKQTRLMPGQPVLGLA